MACDQYNQGLISTFESADHSQVALCGGEFDLPFGRLRVAFDPERMIWANRKLVDLVPIGEFKVCSYVAGWPTPEQEPALTA
jgi:hypothetical protein